MSGYLDSELGPAQRLAVEEHLAVCPTCPPLYAALVRVQASFGALRDPGTVVPDQIASRIQLAVPGGRCRTG